MDASNPDTWCAHIAWTPPPSFTPASRHPACTCILKARIAASPGPASAPIFRSARTADITHTHIPLILACSLNIVLSSFPTALAASLAHIHTVPADSEQNVDEHLTIDRVSKLALSLSIRLFEAILCDLATAPSSLKYISVWGWDRRTEVPRSLLQACSGTIDHLPHFEFSQQAEISWRALFSFVCFCCDHRVSVCRRGWMCVSLCGA